MKDLVQALQPRHAVAIMPSDTVDLPNITSSIYVGVSGDITLDTLGGETSILFKSVPVGDLVGEFKRVRATGTTATNLLARF
jgi:hypothetical protein